MKELEGKLQSQTLSILFDLGASLSYINPRVVENCKLQSQKFKSPCLVQLATGTRITVNTKVSDCILEIVRQYIPIELNILPLGYYDILLGMD